MPYYNNYQQSYSPYGQPNYLQPQFNQPNYLQPQYSQAPTQQPVSSGINWVQGEVGARAYPVAAGNSILLMDSDDRVFYIKSADATGMPSLRKYSYNEIVEDVPRIEQQSHGAQDYDTAQLASRQEVKDLQAEIAELKDQIKTLEAMKDEAKGTRGGKQNG